MQMLFDFMNNNPWISLFMLLIIVDGIVKIVCALTGIRYVKQNDDDDDEDNNDDEQKSNSFGG